MTGKIYRLVDPITSKTHYVGQTVKDLSERLNGHIYESRKYVGTDQETAKHKWIVQLLDKGLLPKIELLETVTKPGKRALDSSEKFWIRSYLGESGQLLNLTYNPNRDRTIQLFNEFIYKPSVLNELEILYLDRGVPFQNVFELYKLEILPIYNALTLFWKERVGEKHWFDNCIYYEMKIKDISIMLYIFGQGKKISYEKLEKQYNSWYRTLRFNIPPQIKRLDTFFSDWVKMTVENMKKQRQDKLINNN